LLKLMGEEGTAESLLELVKTTSCDLYFVIELFLGGMYFKFDVADYTL